MSFLDNISLQLILIACATIGLAPFFPPHIWEKLQMLFAGTLSRPIDILDLLMHGTPWLLLVAKLVRMQQLNNSGGEE